MRVGNAPLLIAVLCCVGAFQDNAWAHVQAPRAASQLWNQTYDKAVPIKTAASRYSEGAQLLHTGMHKKQSPSPSTGTSPHLMSPGPSPGLSLKAAVSSAMVVQQEAQVFCRPDSCGCSNKVGPGSHWSSKILCARTGQCTVTSGAGLNCVCDTGYAGHRCGRCSAGYVGHPKCVPEKQCNCVNGGICNRLSGMCTCPAGTQGPRCEECASGRSGVHCSDELHPLSGVLLWLLGVVMCGFVSALIVVIYRNRYRSHSAGVRRHK